MAAYFPSSHGSLTPTTSLSTLLLLLLSLSQPATQTESSPSTPSPSPTTTTTAHRGEQPNVHSLHAHRASEGAHEPVVHAVEVVVVHTGQQSNGVPSTVVHHADSTSGEGEKEREREGEGGREGGRERERERGGEML